MKITAAVTVYRRKRDTKKESDKMGTLKDKLLELLAPSESVAATDYAAVKGASAGVPVTAQWRDNKVSVGGVLVNPQKVVDGKAIVKKSDIDSAVSKLKQETGVQSGYDILKKYDKYKDMYDEQLEKLTDREEFSYNPENDPVFKSYRQQYNREGARATEDTMGIYSALTGGLANSGAVTAAAQAGQYWSDKLMDVIPELERGAYERYVQEIENDRKALNDIMSVDKYLFDREYGVNEDIKNDILAAQENAQKRDDSIREYNLKRDNAQREYSLKRDTLEAERQADADRLAYERYRDDSDRAAESSQNGFKNALDLFRATGEVSTDAVAAMLGLPAGTVTAEMKSLLTKLAAERENAERKHAYDEELERLKNKNALSQIQARKK